MACNLSFVIENEGVLKVTGSHIHFKSGSVLKMVLDKYVETAVHEQEVQPYSHLAATVMTLGACQGIHQLQAFFYTDKCVAWYLCYSRASCKYFVSYRQLTFITELFEL